MWLGLTGGGASHRADHSTGQTEEHPPTLRQPPLPSQTHPSLPLPSSPALASRLMSGGMMPASMTAWICSRVPAVMLLMVQHASFLMDFF